MEKIGKTTMPNLVQIRQYSREAVAVLISILLVFGVLVSLNAPYANADGIYNNGRYEYAYKESRDLAKNTVQVDVKYTTKGEGSNQKTYADVTYTFNPSGELWLNPLYWFTVPQAFKEPEYINMNGKEFHSWADWESNVHGRYLASKSQNELTGEHDTSKHGFFYEFDKMSGIKSYGADKYDNTGNTYNIVEKFRSATKTIYISHENVGHKIVTVRYRAEVKSKNTEAGLLGGVFQPFKSYRRQVGIFSFTPGDPPPLSEVTTPKLPQKTQVANLDRLTAEEQDTVATKIREANADLVANGTITSVTVDDKGNATVTYKDGSRDIIPSTSLVRQTPPPPVPADGTEIVEVGGLRVVVPKRKMKVGNAENLTNPERLAIREKFYELNRGRHGSGIDYVILDYADGSGSATKALQEGVYAVNSSLRGSIIIRDADMTNRVNIPNTYFATTENENPSTEPAPVTNDEKQKAKDSVNKLTNLTPEEIRNFHDRIDSATTREEIDTVVDEAVARHNAVEEAKTNLEKAKQKGKEDINGLIDLSDEEKRSFIDRINALTYPKTPADVEAIVNEAKARDLANAKENAKASLNDIDPAIKNNYVGRIDGANTRDEIKALVDAARLEDAKAKAIQGVRDLHLPADKETEFINNINNAPNAGVAYAELEKAKAEAKKDEARKKVNAIPGLDQGAKDEFLHEIDEANTTDALDSIVFRAEQKGKIEEAKQEIENLPNLNRGQKDTLKNLLDYASSEDELAELISEGRTLDTAMSRLKEIQASADAKKNSADYNNASENAKREFDQALDEAKSVTPANSMIDMSTDQVNALIERLRVSANNLRPGSADIAPAVNKDKLREEVGQQQSVKSSPEYLGASESKKTDYDNKLAVATDVLNNSSATQDQVDKALSDLVNARLKLDGKPADKEPLRSALEKLNAELAEVEKPETTQGKTPKSVAAYNNQAQSARTTKQNATTVLDSANPTEQDISEAVRKVNKATEDLKAKRLALVEAASANNRQGAADRVRAHATQATGTVNDLALSDGEKTAVNNAINAVRDAAVNDINNPAVTGTPQEVSDRESKAKLDIDKIVAKAKLDAVAKVKKEEVGNLAGLSDAEKQRLKGEVDQAVAAAKANIDSDATDTAGKVDVARGVGELAIDKVAAKAKLDAVAKVKKDEIGNLAGLSDAEKQRLKGEVDQAVAAAKANIDSDATNTAGKVDVARGVGELAIDKIAAKAKLDAVANEAKEKIDALPGLSADQKDAAKAAVDQAVAAAKTNIDSDATNTVGKVDVARGVGELAINKELAKAMVDSLPALGETEKATAKQGIDSANTLDEVLAKSREVAKESVATFDGLTPEEKTAVDSAIDNATTIPEIRSLVEDNKKKSTKAKAKKAIDNKVTETKNEIDNLPGLSEEEKTTLKNEVDSKASEAKRAIDDGNTDTSAEITTAQADGELAIDKVIAKAKLDSVANEAKEKIDALPGLSEAQKDAAKAAVDQALAAAKANVDSNATDTAGKVDAARGVGELAINKELAKAMVDSLPGLSDSEKATAKQGIDDANTVDEVLAKSREVAKASVANLGGLDEAKKNEFNAEIDGANTVPAIREVVKNAKLESNRQLAPEKDNAKREIDHKASEAKNKIDSLPGLSEEEKTALKNEVDSKAREAKANIDSEETDTSERITNAKDAGEVNIDKAIAKAKLDAVAKAKKEEIGNLSGISDSEKKRLQADIDEVVNSAKAEIDMDYTRTTEEVESARDAGELVINGIVAKAKLDSVANEAKEKIDALPGLSEAQKDAAKAGVDQAVAAAKTNIDSDATDTIAKVDAARSVGELAINKEVAKAMVDSLPGLSDSEKATAKQGIDDANTVDEVLAKSREVAKASVATFDGLTPEEKTTVDSAIDNATTIPEIRSLVEDNKKKSDKAKAKKTLDEKAEEAKKAVSELTNLSDEEKKAINERIDSKLAEGKEKIDGEKVNTPEEIDTAEKDGELSIGKEITKAMVTALPNLSDEEKNKFIEEIGEINNSEELGDKLSEAILKDISNLQSEKQKGIETVNALPALTQKDKERINKTINAATTIEEVKHIVSKAELENAIKDSDSTRQKAEYIKADQEKKNAYDEALENGKSVFENPNATTEEINQARDNIIKAKQALNGEENTRKEATEEINKLFLLPEEEKNKFIEEIKNAKLENIDGIVEKAKQRNDEIAKQPATEEDKQKGKEKVDELPNLSEEEKKQAKEEIDNSKTKGDINNAVENAEKKNAQNGTEKPSDIHREKAIEEVNKLPNLTPEEKQKFEEDIKHANTISEVDKALEKARELNDKVGKEKAEKKDLEEAKKKANDEIDSLPNLSPAEKDSAKNSVNGAGDVAGVIEALDSARHQNDSNSNASVLDDAKHKASDEIDSLPNLTPAEKDSAKNSVNGAGDVAGVIEALDSARHQNDSNANASVLDDAKHKANDEIDALPNLTRDQKDSAKNKVNSSTDLTGVNKALEDARKANDDAKPSGDINAERENAKNTVDALPNLSPADKEKFKGEVDSAATSSEIAGAVEKAREANDKAVLDKAKELAKGAVDALPNLSPADKEKFKGEVDSAATSSEIAGAVEKAREANDKAVLDKAKELAKGAVDALPNLSPADKEKFKGEVDSATTPSEIANAVQKARESNDSNMRNSAKEEAKKAIESLPNLTDEEKVKFETTINGAKTEEEISKIVKQARKLNDTRSKYSTAKEQPNLEIKEGSNEHKVLLRKKNLVNTGFENQIPALVVVLGFVGAVTVALRKKFNK